MKHFWEFGLKYTCTRPKSSYDTVVLWHEFKLNTFKYRNITFQGLKYQRRKYQDDVVSKNFNIWYPTVTADEPAGFKHLIIIWINLSGGAKEQR